MLAHTEDVILNFSYTFFEGLWCSQIDCLLPASLLLSAAMVGISSAVPGSKFIILDAEIYVGAQDDPSLLGSLRYFNNNLLDLTSPDSDRVSCVLLTLPLSR